MTVILDNGHGINTKGKQSPDGTLKEYKWAREVVAMIHKMLALEGIKSVILVPEETDISLTTRVARANKIYKEDKQSLLISVHINAAGDGSTWKNATGFSPWVAPNASSSSKKLAAMFQKRAELMGLKGNRCVPSERYWVGNYAIVRDTNCPAVLTENLFQDNKEEVKFLLSAEGKRTIARLHVDTIKEYIQALH